MEGYSLSSLTALYLPTIHLQLLIVFASTICQQLLYGRAVALRASHDKKRNVATATNPTINEITQGAEDK